MTFLLASEARHQQVLASIEEACCVSVLRDLEERITSIVDATATLESKDTVVVQTGFHEELDAAKTTYDHLDGM